MGDIFGKLCQDCGAAFFTNKSEQKSCDDCSQKAPLAHIYDDIKRIAREMEEKCIDSLTTEDVEIRVIKKEEAPDA